METHLTFESIRKLALQHSEPGEEKARQHLMHCDRCQSIHECFMTPDEVRKRHHPRSHNMHMLLIASVITAASLLYLGGSLNLDLSELPYPENLLSTMQKPFIGMYRETKQRLNYSKPTEPNVDVKSPVEADSVKHVVSSNVKVGSTSSSSDHSRPDTGTQEAQKDKVRGIYGKIMANGKPLKGVTIKVPGRRISKVSNSEGKYYIQVPTNIGSLKFIYQGKQLVKELDPTSRNQDLYLKIES